VEEFTETEDRNNKNTQLRFYKVKAVSILAYVRANCALYRCDKRARRLLRPLAESERYTDIRRSKEYVVSQKTSNNRR
jgi:hypothetical protein